MTRHVICILLSMLLIAQVQAEDVYRNWIYQHNEDLDPGDDGNDNNYRIDQLNEKVTIYEGEAGETFELEARWEKSVDGNPPWIDQGPGDINLIEAVAYAGDVTIEILPTGTYTYGACNVEEIDFNKTGVDSEIAGIYIEGNLATDGEAYCNEITGDIEVGGTHGDGPGSTAYRLHADTGTGDITVAGDCVGNLELGTYSTGEISIAGLLLGDLDAGNPHDLTIAGVGEHTGDISFNADAAYGYDLTIGNSGDSNSAMTGDIYIRYGTQGHGGDTGWIRIYGDMQGSIQIGDAEHTGGDNAWGSIHIYGSLYDDITVVDDLGKADYVYRPGLIIVDEDFAPDPSTPTTIPTIAIGGRIVGRPWNATGYGPSMIHIHGDMGGCITETNRDSHLFTEERGHSNSVSRPSFLRLESRLGVTASCNAVNRALQHGL